MGIIIPNLFIVGEPRSGTTSLYYYLKQHPEIYMCPVKEPHYFAQDLHMEHDMLHKDKRIAFPIRNEKEYIKLFKPTKNHKVIGEASTTYLWSKVAAREIYKFNPSAKIIAMFREPVSYLYSLYKFHYALNIEDIPDFIDALNAESDRRNMRRIPKNSPTLTDLFYTYHVKYTEHLKRYTEIFPKEQIKVIIFDDFKNNTEKVYKDILVFLDVDPNFKPDFKVYNPSFEIRFEFLSSLYIHFTHLGLHGKALPDIMKNIINKTLKKSKATGKKERLDPHLKLELMKKFKPEVEKFSAFIGRDLVEEWGYISILK